MTLEPDSEGVALGYYIAALQAGKMRRTLTWFLGAQGLVAPSKKMV